jgi:GT2 family glycosyltransferase
MNVPASRARVTVLIVNYNGWRDTLACLESLYRTDYPDVRVLVLDNASLDDSVAHITRWAARNQGLFKTHPAPELIPLDANLGFAGANNVGLKRMLADSRSGYAWLLNGDAVVSPDTLSRMVALAASDATIGMVGSKILRHDAPETLETAGGGTISLWSGMAHSIRANTARKALWPDPPRMDYVAGTSMLVTRAAIERVGFMDERYFLYAEDADWSIQARRGGLRLAYCAESEVWHKRGGTTVHESPTHDYYTVRSVLLFVQKMRPALLPLAILNSVWRFAVPKIARAQWTRLGAVAHAYVDFARGRRGQFFNQNRGDAVRRSDTLRTSNASSAQ